MPQVGVSYKQRTLAESWDAIVIGSGIGGLATAALLAKYGKKRVLVLERHYTAGGYTHTFTRPGYEWDVGVHYIGQVGPKGPLRPVFAAITGDKLEWAPLPDVYDRILLGGRSYDFVSGTKRFAERMKAYFPSEAKAIDRYIARVRAAVHVAPLYYADRAIPQMASRVAGPLLRAPFLRYAGRTVAEELGSLTKNRELIGVLTGQFGDYGLPPSQASFAMHAAVAHHYFEGAFYPVGGAGEIARHAEPVIGSAGGALVVSAEVEEVLVERGRAVGVRMVDGRTLRAPIVVSDAGLALTYGRLVPPELRPQLDWEGATPSASNLCLYVGMQHTAKELGLAGTNLWIYPGPDHDDNVAKFLADPQAPFPVVYLSFPSAKDPSFEDRCPGRSTLEMVTLAPYAWFSRWEGSRWKKRGGDYDALKARWTERLLQVLYEHVPTVRGKVDVAELSTP
ncbi:MAG: NAD(P)/FAD-dependent oxidoreductase, partial [Myxococcales bacterium]